MIFFLILSIVIIILGALLILKLKNLKDRRVKMNKGKEEFTGDVGVSLFSMGLVLFISTIVKMCGGIGSFGFGVMFVLIVLCLSGLLFGTFKKHNS